MIRGESLLSPRLFYPRSAPALRATASPARTDGALAIANFFHDARALPRVATMEHARRVLPRLLHETTPLARSTFTFPKFGGRSRAHLASIAKRPLHLQRFQAG
jgi:hypothetical protein